jgi:hypothetical protein
MSITSVSNPQPILPSSLQLSPALALQCTRMLKQEVALLLRVGCISEMAEVCISVIKPFTSLKPDIEFVANVYQLSCFGLE